MSSPTQADDALLSASFSLYSNPGAYALLLGAGVSASSGILTAWPLLMDLVGQVATLEGEEPEDPEAWYLDKFGVAPTYEGVLEKLGPTQHERQRLLRGYFERSAEDIEADEKLPTPAHRAIARLVRAGAVRVIVTLNFDHLIEQAIRDEGLEPTIVASPADITGMAPLHTLDCCVVHLHGDYLDPTSMRNTVDELGEYDPATQNLLERILQDYGLIVAGWSAAYDPVLRKAIAEHYSTRFTMTWIERSEAKEDAAQLRILKKGVAVTADADTAFGHLADGVAALTARQSRHPLTIPVAVETAKRELAGRPVAIGLHDRLRQELGRLHDRPEFYVYTQKDPGPYEELVERVEEATLLPAALVATLAYWGSPETDRWWLSEVPRFATGVDGSGSVRLLNLRVVSGAMLFYAAGIAAVAAQRYDLLGQLFAARRSRGQGRAFETLGASLRSSSTYYEDASDRDTRLHGKLAPLLQDVLKIGHEPLEDAWQAFELLRMTWVATQHQSFDELRDEYWRADDKVLSTEELARATEEPTDTFDDVRATEHRFAFEARDRHLGRLGRLARVGRPHILASEREMRDDWAPNPVVRRLIDDVQLDGNASPLVTTGLFRKSGDALLAMQAVSAVLGATATDLIEKQLPPGGGAMPWEIWLDSGLPPVRESPGDR